MQTFREVTATAVPIDRANIDTDAVLPAIYMKRVTRSGYGDVLFLEWKKDPNFVLNRPEYQGASILITGPNFGCGSSREHAPWALRDGGFRAIISPSFADIFRGNCLRNGLLPVILPEAQVHTLMQTVEADPATTITIDLVSREVRCPRIDLIAKFSLDDHNRTRLLEGLDDIDLTMRHMDDIRRYEASRSEWMPSDTVGSN
ncbi:MAG: 3-isopropylmalate dehydratase small subunit [Pseudonocardiales bacterium]|nr:MAG: 3-isopropylmalate dehydratase small subunit [Pseudonocardiales bacterium]